MDDDELRMAYIDYSHEEFKRSPEASEYLGKRGLTNTESFRCRPRHSIRFRSRPRER